MVQHDCLICLTVTFVGTILVVCLVFQYCLLGTAFNFGWFNYIVWWVYRCLLGLTILFVWSSIILDSFNDIICLIQHYRLLCLTISIVGPALLFASSKKVVYLISCFFIYSNNIVSFVQYYFLLGLIIMFV